jgi:hypothetical protein
MEARAYHLSNQRRSCGGIARDARLFWKYKSRAASSKPKIPAETVALIKEMAAQNRLWGAELLRGELLKLGIHVCWFRWVERASSGSRIPSDPFYHFSQMNEKARGMCLSFEAKASSCLRFTRLRRIKGGGY